jgi:hypothetical protein
MLTEQEAETRVLAVRATCRQSFTIKNHNQIRRLNNGRIEFPCYDCLVQAVREAYQYGWEAHERAFLRLGVNNE